LKKISNNLKFENGKEEIDYEKSLKVMCSLILRLKILCDITLLKEIKSIFTQILIEEMPDIFKQILIKKMSDQNVELEDLLNLIASIVIAKLNLNTSTVIANILLQYGLEFSRD
jgi:hypothetical protein